MQASSWKFFRVYTKRWLVLSSQWFIKITLNISPHLELTGETSSAVWGLCNKRRDLCDHYLQSLKLSARVGGMEATINIQKTSHKTPWCYYSFHMSVSSAFRCCEGKSLEVALLHLYAVRSKGGTSKYVIFSNFTPKLLRREHFPFSLWGVWKFCETIAYIHIFFTYIYIFLRHKDYRRLSHLPFQSSSFPWRICAIHSPGILLCTCWRPEMAICCEWVPPSFLPFPPKEI